MLQPEPSSKIATPKSVKKVKKRPLEQDVNVIQEIYADHKKRMSEREEKMLSKSNVDLFFEHCAQRVKALDGTVQGVVQIQVH